MKEVLIKAAPIVVRLCHPCVHTSRADPWENHAAGIVYLVGSNLRQGRTKIDFETTKFIWPCIIHGVINVSCIALRLCSAAWTKLWKDAQPACDPGQQTMVDVCHGEGNECWVDFINWWSMIHSHLFDAMKVCPVNTINNVSQGKLTCALRNWLSKQRSNKKVTLELPHYCLWGMSTCAWPISGATSFLISVGDIVWNLEPQSIEVMQQYRIDAWEQVILARAFCQKSAMEQIIEMIHLLLNYRHMEGLRFCGLDQSW